MEAMTAQELRRRCRDGSYAGPTSGHALGKVLRLLVISSHVVEAHRIAFGSNASVRNSDAPDRARVDHPFDTASHGRREHVPGALYIGLVKLRRISSPQAVVRGYVENQPAARNSPLQRIGVAQVAGYALDIEFGDMAG